MATYYWVGGGGTWNSTSTTNWSGTSGGPGGAGYPTILDDVIFDNNSGTGTINVATGYTFCRNFTVTASQSLLFNGITTGIAGDVFLPSGGSTSYLSFAFNCIANSAKTITTNGKTIQQLTFNGINGSWTLQGALTVSSSTTLTAGTFNTNNQALTTGTFTSTASNNRAINLGSSTVTIQTQGAAWTLGGTNLTFNAGTSTINLNLVDFVGGGLTYNNVSFTQTSMVSGAIQTISGTNTFNNLTIASPNASSINIVTISDNQTVTGTLTAAGATNTQRIAIYSNAIGTQRTLTVNAWSASPANLDFRDIRIAGAVGTLSGTSIGDCGNNSGITFTAAKTVYWNLGSTTNWSSTGWATLSGGSPNSANFPLAQDTCVFDNAGAMGTVIFNVSWNIGTINASARTSGGFSQGASSTINIYGDVVFGSGMSSTANSTGVWNFAKQGIQTINLNGANLNSIISINSATGTLRLLGNLTHNFSATTTLTSGTFDLNNFTFSTNGIFAIAANALARSIAFGTGNITLSDTVASWSGATLTNFTLTGTPTVNLTGASTSGTRTIQHGSTTGFTEANAISVNVTAGSSTSIITFQGGFRDINLTGFAANFANATRTIYGNLLISTGTTVTAGSSTTTFAGTSVVQDLTSNGRTLDFPININGAGNTLRLLDALNQGTTYAFTINSGTTFDANNFSASVANLTFTATPNIINLVSGTLTTQTVTHTSGTLTMSAALKINVTGTYTFTAGTLDFGNQSVSFGSFSSSNFNTRTINLGSGTLTITGTSQCWNTISASGLTLNAGTSTISFTNAGTKQMSTEGLTFYNVNQGGAGALTIAGSASASVFNNISNSVAPTTILFPNSFITSVRNLNLNGTAGNLVTIGGSTAASNFSLEYIGSTVSTMNFVSISYAQIQRAGAVYATNSTDGGNNLNLTFGAADTTPRYWVGGTGTWTSTANTNWSTSSGGSGGASAPTIETDVFFDANSNVGTSTFTVSLSGTSTTQLACRDLTISGLDGTLTWAGTGALNIYGSASFPATNFTRTFTGSYTFRSTTTGKIITSNGQTITSSTVTFDGVGGGWTLTDAFAIGSFITLTNGSFNTGGFTLTTAAIFSTNSNVRSINFGASTVNLTSNTPIIFGNITNLTFNAGTSTIAANNGNNTQTNYGGLTYYNYVQNSPAGSEYQITGENTFNNFTVNVTSNPGHLSYIFTANTTINGTLSFTGQIVTRRVFLRSNTIGTQRRLNINAISGVSDIDFRDIAITGAVGTLSGTRLGDCGGNSGITFTAPKNVYWNLAGSSNWTDNAWALTPTGTPDANNFPLAQDTAIFTNSGGSGTLSGPTSAYNMPSIDMSARTTAFTWQSTTNLFYYGNLLFGTGITIAGVSGYSLAGRGSYNILTSGKTFPGNMLVNCVSGTYTLNDAFTSTNRLDLQSGTLNTNNQTVTFTAFEGNYTAARALILGTSTLNLTTTGTVFSPGTTTLFTFSGESSTLNLTDSSTSSRTISGNGLKFGTLNIGGSLGTSTLSLSGGGTSFNNITSTKTVAHTISIPGSETINFNNFNVSGSPGRLVTLTGSVSNASLYNYTGLGVVSVDYLNVTGSCGFTPVPNSSGTTPYRWYLGENSINQTNAPTSSGSAFITGNKRAYLLNSTGSFGWTVPKDWNNNDNIIHMIGAGGGGTGSVLFGSNRAGGAGGGGGGYTSLSNITLQPNSLLAVSVGAAQGSGNTKGNDTYISTTYFAGGGQAGNIEITVPRSTGGQGGIGGTFNGGNGGSGSFAIAASTAHGGGGGGGSAGPFGKGGNGGNGFSGLTNADAASGGGGGNGGGTNGSDATLATPGQGGNGCRNILGASGGSFSVASGTGTAGTRGGGGGGSRISSSLGGSGSSGLDIHNTIGSGGAPGGNQSTFDFGAGGTGGGMQTGGAGGIPTAGGQGVIFIVYTPLPYNARLFSNGDFLLRYNMQLDEMAKRTFSYDQSAVYSSQFDEISYPENLSVGSFDPALGSLLFNGTNNFLGIQTNSSLILGTGSFTFEAWIYKTSYTTNTPTNYELIYSSAFINGFNVYIDNTGRVGSASSQIIAIILSTNPVPLNAWTHIAVVRNRTSYDIYFNGVRAATTVTNSTNFSAASTVQVGAEMSATNTLFRGYISNLRVVNGTALYTDNFTPPRSPLTDVPGTALLLNTATSNPFVDSSSNRLTVTNSGSVQSSVLSPFTPVRPAMRTNSTGNTFITGSFDEVTGIY
jgi:hypothetical protein